MTHGQKLRFFRLLAEISQTQLTALTGLSQKTVAEYEAGKVAIY